MNDYNWQFFFDHHAPHYMNEGFTRGTIAEVDFLAEHLRLRPGMRVLDVGCGTGRHAVELAGRGYRITGVDISDGMLAEAARAASAAGVEVEWVRCAAQARGARLRVGSRLPRRAHPRNHATDVGRFMLAHLGAGCLDGSCILSPESVAQMQQQFTHHPELVGMAYGFAEARMNAQRFLWPRLD